MAVTDLAGDLITTNTYDEYGIPDVDSMPDPQGDGITTKGRFRYTGQVWLPELEMYYYKARIYSPKLGRFLQTDPIGYEDKFNLYAYVGNDPINGVDPNGEDAVLITWPILEGKPHSSLYIYERGKFEDGTLYDPAGSYQHTDEWGATYRNSSGVYDVPLQEYLRYWTKTGSSLKGLRFTFIRTTDKEVDDLVNAALEAGDPTGYNCARYCSSVLSIIKGLEGSNRLPSQLADRVARSKRAFDDFRVDENGQRIEESEPTTKVFDDDFCRAC